MPSKKPRTDGVPDGGARGAADGKGADVKIEVRRSKRRRRTVSAYRDDDRVVIMIPARFTRAEEREWIATMLERLDRSERRRRPSDKDLTARAERLSAKYLGGAAQPSSVRWVDNQKRRWGSCTPEDGTIRLSTRLVGMPSWVIDYVLLHELAHLIETGHTPAFWGLVNQLPKSQRAQGYLEGVAAASSLDINDDDLGGETEDVSGD